MTNEVDTHDDQEFAPGLTRDERYLLAAVCRRARTQGWSSGHRLGWVHQARGVAVGREPGVLLLWRRDAGGRWPTHPSSHPVGSLNEVLHILEERKLLPGWFCVHGRRAMAEIARICDLAADDLDRQAVVPLAGDEVVAARVWREVARRARDLAGLKASA